MCDNPEFDSSEQSSTGRAPSDRPEDPLFPLLPQVLEALRNKALERRTSESTGGGDDATPDDYALLIESICGAIDDSQPVEQYDGTLGVTQGFVNDHQRAVGQIQWNDNLASIYTNPGNVAGARWCTGTLITDDLFLTAGHCFDQTGGGWQRPRTNGTSNIIPSSEIATNMRVNFNYQVDPSGTLRTATSYAITQLVEYRLGGLDFAIVRLGGNPGATWGTTPLATADAATGDMLCIIGHPAGLPKRIEAGPALASSGNQVRYNDIDTLGGNSGSGVLRAADGRIVGVHTNGGCGPGSPGSGGANFRMRIAALIAASPTLQTLTRPSIKVFDDGGSAKITDDGGTLKFGDDGGSIKVFDDGGSVKFSDDGGTSPVRDNIQTRKHLDDVKTPALDKGPADKLPNDSKLPAFDGGGFPYDPGRPPVFRGTARPFALATPHQSMAWTGEQQQDAQAQAYEAALHQLGELIQQQQQVLGQLDQEYRQLLAEYQQVAQGRGA